MLGSPNYPEGPPIISGMSSVQIIWFKICFVTSNVTGCHRGPKRKLQAGYRVPSLQRTFYLSGSYVKQVLFFIVECGIARFLCAMRPMPVIDVLSSSSPPGYLCAKFSFCRGLHCWDSPSRKIAYSITQSPSLFDVTGTEVLLKFFNSTCIHIYRKYRQNVIQIQTICRLKITHTTHNRY